MHDNRRARRILGAALACLQTVSDAAWASSCN
jgi:hypothetical protein